MQNIFFFEKKKNVKKFIFFGLFRVQCLLRFTNSITRRALLDDAISFRKFSATLKFIFVVSKSELRSYFFVNSEIPVNFPKI